MEEKEAGGWGVTVQEQQLLSSCHKYESSSWLDVSCQLVIMPVTIAKVKPNKCDFWAQPSAEEETDKKKWEKDAGEKHQLSTPPSVNL